MLAELQACWDWGQEAGRGPWELYPGVKGTRNVAYKVRILTKLTGPGRELGKELKTNYNAPLPRVGFV